MAQPSPENADEANETSTPDDLADPLDSWARATSLALGIACAGFGCYAVFVSANQAGTAFLLIAGLVLLLLALQGTPLRTFGGGEYRVELARLRRRAVQVVDRAAREDGPDVAAAVADAVSSIGVQVSDLRLIRYRRYGDQVELRDTTELTQFGDAEAGFRNRLRASLGETEMSLLMGRQNAIAASLLITKGQYSLAAVRYTTAGALRRAGFEVVHTPTRGNPLHVSVFPQIGTHGPTEWTDTMATSFDMCFSEANPH
ncbi:hypothetical protein ACGF5H_17110 [Micromonospora chalcea]